MKKLIVLNLLCLFMPVLLIQAQNNLPYLGQDPPGMTAKRFPPDSLLGNSNWWWHGSPVFTPDGLDMFWTEYVRYSPTNELATLFNMKVENNNWGVIHHPSFGNQNYFENNPVLSVGGDTLYYFSTKPGGLFFMTTHTATGWSQPSPVYIPTPPGCGIGLQFAVNRAGDFYIEVSIPPSAPPDLYVSRLTNGSYQMAEKLGPEINSDYLDAFPFVDPDEEYLIFASNRPGGFGGQFDNYICFKNPDGTWTDAMNMGYEINSAGAWFASVTLDNQYLFFNSWKSGDQGYNPYWISASVIDSLKLLVGLREPENPSVKTTLYLCEPNPSYGQTAVSFETGAPATLSLLVVDIMGETVLIPAKSRYYPAGKHTVTFNVSELPAGMYLVVLRQESGRFVTQRMIVRK